ncbi:MAG TPA: hypothetical protein VFY16_05545 [Gemmatimonadaceae bacterium]|jgi:hypothetical protein|nr:hypothetical protein [Gemmatimonadaceae bacterium]
MFIALLFVTFVIAATTSFVVARAFHRPVAVILTRIVADELALAWQRYVVFAIYLVGINGGVRIWELEKYVAPRGPGAAPLVLDSDRWALEVYRTLIEALQSIAWALLAFFGVALLAYLVVRALELRAGRQEMPGRAA